MRLSMLPLALSARTLKCFLMTGSLLILLPRSAVGETITLTSGAFGFFQNSALHSINFSISGDDDVSISGQMVDDGIGQQWACNFSGIGGTSCQGGFVLELGGSTYTRSQLALSIPQFPNLNADPGLVELSETFSGGLSIRFSNPCVSPGQNCLGDMVLASGMVSGTVHYKEIFPGAGFYRADSAQGAIIAEPRIILLLVSGFVLCCVRKYFYFGLRI